jgi:hypothetical protein
MEGKQPKTKDLSERRFSLIFFFFRLGGIPFKMNKTSTAYALYMRIVVFCGCSTTLAMFCDVYQQRNDLERVITNIRLLIPAVNAVWTYFYCRYVEASNQLVGTVQINRQFHTVMNKNKGRIVFHSNILPASQHSYT